MEIGEMIGRERGWLGGGMIYFAMLCYVMLCPQG